MFANNLVVLLTLNTFKPIKWVKSYSYKKNVKARCVQNVICVVQKSEYDQEMMQS